MRFSILRPSPPKSPLKKAELRAPRCKCTCTKRIKISILKVKLMEHAYWICSWTKKCKHHANIEFDLLKSDQWISNESNSASDHELINWNRFDLNSAAPSPKHLEIWSPKAIPRSNLELNDTHNTTEAPACVRVWRYLCLWYCIFVCMLSVCVLEYLFCLHRFKKSNYHVLTLQVWRSMQKRKLNLAANSQFQSLLCASFCYGLWWNNMK